MKKLITIVVLLLTFTTFSQEKQVQKQSIEDIIKPYLTKALDAGEKGVNFVADEAPVVIKQYLIFESLNYLFWIGIGLIIITIGINISNKFILTKEEMENTSNKYKVSKSRYVYNNENNIMPYYILRISGYIIGLLLVTANIMSFIKVTFLPKLYLTEKFINLL